MPTMTQLIEKWFDEIKAKTKKYQIFDGFFLDAAKKIAVEFAPILLKILVDAAVVPKGALKAK